MIGIYKITNNVNGKIYIGQSWDIEKRLKEHKIKCHNKHLLRSFDKYGLENFSFETLIEFKDGPFTQKYLDKFEDYFIKQFDSINEGYNKKEGGSHGKHLEEVRKIMSEKKKLFIKNNPEEIKRISEMNKKIYINNPEARKENSERVKNFYRNNPEAGKKNNERIRQFYIDNPEKALLMQEKRKQFYKNNPGYMSRAKKKFYKNNPDFIKREKKVICIETGEVFKSATEVREKKGISNAHISSVCNGKRNTAGGFHWKFINEDKAEE